MSEGAEVRAVIGTAGHVDHGKTTLVGALTGIDTDRLSEEKERGISIELGFAWLDLPGGRVAMIDVPGHERFVRQMIAGAAGIDLVLLVIAADEGVMPQTREHLDICGLLGIRHGAVVVTKTDLVDEEWLELVDDDIAEVTEGTFLEGAPTFRFAAGDQASVATLREQLGELVTTAAEAGLLGARSSDRPFKLSSDRVFTIRGFGTVVTGTVASGRLAVGDPIFVLPAGHKGRVRGLQVHETSVDAVSAGVRVAINIQGVEHHAISRGDVICGADALPVVSMVDATFTALRRLAKPVKDRSRVLVHVGTAHAQATLALIGAEEVEPGATVSAQLRFDEPVVILPGEPYVVRGFSTLEGYGKTTGGGVVLMPQRRRHRRADVRARKLIESVATGDPLQVLVGAATFAGEQGLARADLDRWLPLERAAIAAGLQTGLADGRLLAGGSRVVASEQIDALATACLTVLSSYHETNPSSRGVSVDELRSRLRPDLPAELFGLAAQRLTDRGDVVARGEVIALPGFEPRLTAAQQRAVDAVAQRLSVDGLAPTRVPDLPEELDLSGDMVRLALDWLLAEGAIVRISEKLMFSAAALGDLEARLVATLRSEGTVDTAKFKALTGVSRKWTIPLGEYFDRIRLTLRVGDTRRLRSDGSS